MKKIIIGLLLSTAGFVHANDNISWNKILKGTFYTTDSLSFMSPDGASLFNVCNYDAETFKVIAPKPECHQYETVIETRRGVKGEKTTMCAHKPVAPAEKLIKNTKTVCAEEVVETVGQTRRDSYTVTKCLGYEEMAIPNQQEVDVYRTRRDNVFAFTKTYTIPDCPAPALRPEKVPSKKN